MDYDCVAYGKVVEETFSPILSVHGAVHNQCQDKNLLVFFQRNEAIIFLCMILVLKRSLFCPLLQ